ncbi:hypothetical protein DL96DRAFT_1714379 [Flagelloscypha sp. PMI_526]|nr:hypothetical protein DL96DRAFT_1714379 [Flagelloscypha sp. PMI_526]
MRVARPSFSNVPEVFRQTSKPTGVHSQEFDQISPDSSTAWTPTDVAWADFHLGMYQMNNGLISQSGYLPSPTETVSTFEELETPPCYFDVSPSVMSSNIFDKSFSLAVEGGAPNPLRFSHPPQHYKAEPHHPMFEHASYDNASAYSLYTTSSTPANISPITPSSASSPTSLFFDIPDFQHTLPQEARTSGFTPREASPASSCSSAEYTPVTPISLPPSHPPPRIPSSDPKRRFPCTTAGCSRRFTSQYTLSVHLQAHQPKPRPSFPCTAGCKERFSRAHDRLRHEVAKHGKVCEHSCLECGRFFSSERTLGNHRCPVQKV